MYISGVLLPHQILKRQLLHQMFIRKLLILLVHCFFSVIWNISQTNVFKTKCKLKCQNYFFGNLETPVFIFYVFITEIYLTNIWRDNWRSVFDVVKGLCFYSFFLTFLAFFNYTDVASIITFLLLFQNTIYKIFFI